MATATPTATPVSLELIMAFFAWLFRKVRRPRP